MSIVHYFIHLSKEHYMSGSRFYPRNVIVLPQSITGHQLVDYVNDEVFGAANIEPVVPGDPDGPQYLKLTDSSQYAWLTFSEDTADLGVKVEEESLVLVVVSSHFKSSATEEEDAIEAIETITQMIFELFPSSVIQERIREDSIE